MPAEVGEWLTAVLAEDPEVGRLIGEAVTVLFTEGVGTPLTDVLAVENPHVALDHAYWRMLSAHQTMRRELADLASARLRAERDLADAGGDEETLAGVRRRLRGLAAEEERTARVARSRQRWLDGFRSGKEVAKARYSLVLAQREVERALTALGEPSGLDPGGALESARSTVHELLRTAETAEVRPVLKELRLETVSLRLLFAVDDPDTVIPLVAGIGSDDWAEWYADAMRLAQDGLYLDDEDLTGYDRAAFLSAYFPGAESDVEAGAVRLLESNAG
jgi:hypothetical protein